MKKLLMLIPSLMVSLTWAQTYTMQQLVDSALINNKLLQIKTYQIKEKQAALASTNQLRLPNLTIMGNYMYNFTPLRVNVPAGALGSTPIPGLPISIPIPFENVNQVIGKNNTVVAGAILYQPITEQFKISNGTNVKKIDVRIIEAEQQQTAEKIKNGIQQLYLGINATRYAITAIEGSIELAQAEVDYIQVAIESEKAIPMNYYGLKASLADEKQKKLKKEAELLKMVNTLNQLTQLQLTANQISDQVVSFPEEETLSNYVAKAQNSPDYQIAYLNQQKAIEGIRATKNSYLPDLGVIGGYMYQYGIDYINNNFAVLGVNLKWNINDIFRNKQEQHQREALKAQATLFAEHTQSEIEQNINTAYQELMLAKQLILVAEEVDEYRLLNFEMHKDKFDAGLINYKELVKTKQEHTKAKSDYYAALLNYQIHLSQIRALTGQ